MSIENKIYISLQAPHKTENNRYFSFRIKEKVDVESVQYPLPDKILVLSGIEGNFHSLCNILYRGHVIDKYLHWKYGSNHLVILGNCFNLREDAIECLWLVYYLEQQSKKAGGYLHFILGSNEISNLHGDWRYAHPKYAQKAKFKRTSTALYGGNYTLWQWMRTKNIVEKIGNLLFVHGGISKEVIESGFSIQEINDYARFNYTDSTNALSDPKLALLFGTKTSPFLYRGYFSDMANENLINETLARYETTTIITGQTLIGYIESYFNGKIINVNADHSTDKSEGLVIHNHKFFRMPIKGNKNRIK